MNTICKPSDKLRNTKPESNQDKLCSRCNKIVTENEIVINPDYLKVTRTKWKCYRYHPNCIETNLFNLKLNWIRFFILYKLERIHRKMNFLQYFGLSWSDYRRRIKQTRSKN